VNNTVMCITLRTIALYVLMLSLLKYLTWTTILYNKPTVSELLQRFPAFCDTETGGS